MARRRGDDVRGEPAFGARVTHRGEDVFAEPALGAADERVHPDPHQWVGDETGLGGAGRDGPAWRDHVARMRAATSDVRRAWALVAAAIVGGLFAVLGAFIASAIGRSGSFAFLIAVVLLGPAVEEVLKVAGAQYLVERRPWLVTRARVLPIVALGAGIVFAAIENVVYLNVYIPDPSEEITVFRWIMGPLLHGSASFVAGIGVMRQHRRQEQWFAEGGPARPGWVESAAWPWLLAAWILHGAWNLLATILSVGGWWVPTG